MPLVSCISINHSGKRQVIFVWWLVNFPDSFARLHKLSKLWQRCEQLTLEGWILLNSLPIFGSGAAGLCLSGISSQNDILARSEEQKLGLGASGCPEAKNCLFIFIAGNIAGKSRQTGFGTIHLWGFLWTSLQWNAGPSHPLLHSWAQSRDQNPSQNCRVPKGDSKSHWWRLNLPAESVEKAPEKNHLKKPNWATEIISVGTVAKGLAEHQSGVLTPEEDPGILSAG